jgi:hypothetical protein
VKEMKGIWIEVEAFYLDVISGNMSFIIYDITDTNIIYPNVFRRFGGKA